MPSIKTSRVLVVLNPRASSGRAGALQERLQDAFLSAGMEAEFCLTQAPGDATCRVAELAPDHWDVIAAAGGDGTVFEVLNGLMQRPAAQREALGVIPVGTGNAFARDLALTPGDWQAGVRLIASGQRRRVDVGRVSCAAHEAGFYFLNIIGAGFVVDAGLAALRLKRLGKAAYTMGTLSALTRLRSYPMSLELDGQKIDGDFLFIEVSNSRYTGTHFLMAPGARLDDGMLDVTLVDRVSRRRLLGLFPTIYDGRHVEVEEVTVRQAREIRLNAPAGLATSVDGEFKGILPMNIHCLPGVLELCAPVPA